MLNPLNNIFIVPQLVVDHTSSLDTSLKLSSFTFLSDSFTDDKLNSYSSSFASFGNPEIPILLNTSSGFSSSSITFASPINNPCFSAGRSKNAPLNACSSSVSAIILSTWIYSSVFPSIGKSTDISSPEL